MFWEDNRLTTVGKEALLQALKLTASDRAEPDHLLLAMIQAPESKLSCACLRLRPALGLKSLSDTIVASLRSRTPQSVPDSWSDSIWSDRSQKMIAEANGTTDSAEVDQRRGEALLAAMAIEYALPRVQRVFDHMGLPTAELLEELRAKRDVPRPQPFDEEGQIQRKAFLPSGRAILQLMETEGKGLGLTRVGTPLALFAFVARENGLMERALRLQVVEPKKVHESLLIHLRALGSRRFSEELSLLSKTMQPAVVSMFERAADLTHERGLERIGEAELLKALLLQKDLFVESNLTAAKVKLDELLQYIMQRHSGEQEAVEEKPSVPPAEEIEGRLRQKVIGQDHAIDVVLPIIKRMRFGFTRENRPLGVLLFLGASGTGKTQLAKEIARSVYGSEENLIFLEMGQFGTEVSKNIFVGAPPGYVGYGEGLLTNGLRDKPESVVLFDEVEKAHPSVFDVLLRFLDEGQIADPAGPVRDGSKCMIVLTSNHAIDTLGDLIERQSQMKNMPPDERDRVRAEVRRAIMATKFFRPEFLNRVDEMILFNNFDASGYRRIVTNQLEHDRNRLLKEKKLEVRFGASLVDEIVERCCQRRDEGARVCGKLIGQMIIGPLIDFFLERGNENVRAADVTYEPSRGVRIQAGEPTLAEVDV